jgi:hypothetical protein
MNSVIKACCQRDKDESQHSHAPKQLHNEQQHLICTHCDELCPPVHAEEHAVTVVTTLIVIIVLMKILATPRLTVMNSLHPEHAANQADQAEVMLPSNFMMTMSST